jgi:hypothetical protein
MSADSRVVGYCRACGRALDESTVRTAQGTIFCEEHVPREAGAAPAAESSPYTAPVPPAMPNLPPMPNLDVSPGLAFGLGFIPGVGAIYNGQYAKGLVHAVIIGLIISIMNNAEGSGLDVLLAFMMIGFWLYMPFEAFHTAKKRQMGQPVEEFSSLIPIGRGASRIPVAPVVLIALGVVFLLNNLQILELRRLLRYWPVLLIALGVYMLGIRVSAARQGDKR